MSLSYYVPCMAEIDQEALKKYSFAVWSYKQGEVVSALIHLGDRLGLFHAMAGVGRVDSHTLGESTGLHERFVREWLNGMAAARLISRVDDTYELSVEGAAVLADEEGAVTFSAGAFRGGFSPDTLDAIAESFRTGVGITYEQQGPSAAAGLARMTGPWTRHALVSTLLPRLDGVVDKLNNAARVVDIGCGAGVTTCTLAESFPNSTVVGYDPSTTAVSQAQELAGSKGLDNVEFIAAGGEDVPDDASADLVLTFDCLHDMPRPDITMEADPKDHQIRRVMGHQGHPLERRLGSRQTQSAARHVLRVLSDVVPAVSDVGTWWNGPRHFGSPRGKGQGDDGRGRLRPVHDSRHRRAGESVLRSQGLTPSRPIGW